MMKIKDQVAIICTWKLKDWWSWKWFWVEHHGNVNNLQSYYIINYQQYPHIIKKIKCQPIP